MSNDNSLEKIIAALGEEELELTGEEIAEILWLTLQRQEIETTELPSTVENVSSDNPLSEETNDFDDNFSSDTTLPEGIDNSPDLTDLPSSPHESVEPVTTPLYANEPTFDDEEVQLQENFLPLRVPDAPSVREPLNLVKALRPLMQRVASGRATVLDEVATAESVGANESILVPVFKQELEPWLDLALVIDQSNSMVIWRQTVEDLRRLFKHYGIFRDVRVWDLITSSQGKIALQPHKSQSQRLANPLELVEPNGRRLILIVSDCVAPMWSTGLINPTLQTWTKHQPVAIMQMLPDWLWLRSGLGLGAKVSFVNSLAGAANQRIKVNDLLLWQDIDLDMGIKIPVINLDPESSGPWGQMVAGNVQVEALGFVLSDKPYTPPSKGTTTPNHAVDPEQRIQRFRRTASPLARKLAGLLGAAPVINLPIVRSVQATLLPQSNQINVAEVFLGGLLKPITKLETDTEPDTVRYEFMTEEIRKLLLKDSPVKDSTQVIDAVSRYVADGLGKSMQEFVALLRRPGQGVEEEVREFARLTAKVLQQLGGEYAKFAQELEDRHNVDNKGSSTRHTIQILKSDLTQSLHHLAEELQKQKTSPTSQIISEPPHLMNWQGRENELQFFQNHLSPSSHNLIGIHGLGGAGKSYLAAYGFQEFTTKFVNKLWVDFASVPSFDLFVEEALFKLGGLTPQELPQTSQERQNFFLSFLNQKPYFLVLDNLESLFKRVRRVA